jgi:hypothetical protein
MKRHKQKLNQFPRLDKSALNNLTDADIDELYLAWEKAQARAGAGS